MMKRIFLIILAILLLSLFGCGIDYDTSVSGEGEKESYESDTSGYVYYIVNTSSRTYHYPSCYLVEGIKDENRVETNDKAFLIEREYTPCKICIDK